MERAERVVLCNMCMIENELTNQVVLQHRTKKDWQGWAFPGGHLESGESLQESVIREVLEETGLEISNPQLTGIKHWEKDGIHYLVFHYKAGEFQGQLRSSSEGEVRWFAKNQLAELDLAYDMLRSLEMMDNPAISELFYREKIDGDWTKEFF
ncbi:8-oxo-dGTP diphosphatase [Streptococcus oricebi]|uniref:NUDIX hydrolase n=1 Tax=Streptococcus oricebi TaxID=1547447 RepID=A0ABS5B6C2_9STRE|nr:8-oxo-dGTP diphosphatase [Streptococcus oricebi]MBP2624041.1 NUDIX hydrolase [Streptococcus oricebi]